MATISEHEGDMNTDTDTAHERSEHTKKHPEDQEDTTTLKSNDYPYHIPLISVHKQMTGQEPNYTNYTTTFIGTLDYIFVSSITTCVHSVHVYPMSKCDDIETNDAGSINTNEVMMEQSLSMPPYPNETWPSDHLLMKSNIGF